MQVLILGHFLAARAGDSALAIQFSLPPALIIGFVVSTILPLLVGLVTTRVTSAGVKAVLLAALAAVTGLLTELLASINAGVAYDIGNGLVLALTGFLVAVGFHFGLWKPTTLTEKVQNTLVKAPYEPQHELH
jgi:hypothetical protein